MIAFDFFASVRTASRRNDPPRPPAGATVASPSEAGGRDAAVDAGRAGGALSARPDDDPIEGRAGAGGTTLLGAGCVAAAARTADVGDGAAAARDGAEAVGRGSAWPEPAD
jgi:hypothetical protein